VLTLALQAQPVKRAAAMTIASSRLRICFISLPPVRMLTELVCRRAPGLNKEIFNQ
jgi:hypothetical protein